MEATTSSIAELRNMYRRGEVHPEDLLDAAVAHTNGNAGKNVYLSQDREWSRSQARELRTGGGKQEITLVTIGIGGPVKRSSTASVVAADDIMTGR